MKEFNPELCDQRHVDQERRLSVVESALKDGEAKQEERIARIHIRFDEVTKELLRRLPGWVTVLIGLLSAMVAGLAVAAIK
jgi:hypothetical protein